MNPKLYLKSLSIAILILSLGGCAYFNTFYNAQQYYDEAEKIRLQKEGESISITALDKYGKTIQKCHKVLGDYPDSKFRNDAILLMSKARFYRKDYDLALDDLKIIIDKGNEKQKEDAYYWRALCKWKKGNAQTGINELTDLLEVSYDKQIQSKCYLSLAEIVSELKEPEKAMAYLLEGAKLTKDRDQKGIIYGRLAEMAFNRENYELAMDGYKNVIAHSLSKQKGETAHLQVLKILRIQKKYRSASRKIKGMLTDDKFKGIAGNLELELVQLYREQNEIEDIESRLESIVNTYQRTPVSAEAYYLLGQYNVSQNWDLDKAKNYFNLVSKESSKSLFSPIAKSKSKAIDIYQEAEKDLEKHIELLSIDSSLVSSETDSNDMGVSVIIPDRSIPELYYQLADLESFKFNRNAEGISYLKIIISDYPESPFHAKAMFAISFMFDSNGDSLEATIAQEQLEKTYPNSEYTAYLKEGVTIEINEQEEMYKLAETQITNNPENAIQLMKEALDLNESSELAPSLAFTISYYYDQIAEIDSAMKYYEWIQENHPRSDQYDKSVARIQALQLVLSSIELPQDSLEVIQEEN
ncbi:MAG: hypothetical protein HOB40_07295 [Candidatus Marinimicrobia bacterium]|jgi:tetratricopeptide (TPR) repeat protein|nr:hypothetical protein [Candidatus Neomarinimicrobiota bacterium]MBT3501203.1 hypothetical protein [Candidatus Neomarinimicrobiota bacterium]MBT3839485.1 hypothetical protein [Candidatus Neomarinimicrobiota bacterium]MBT3999385.1 hypothetical protein [Candidatus Neomarinimicrobiota bacterium]MBT4282008.1 hypothetical protein [Candidatus Neomarinimicrobiota bacterium]